MNSWAADCSAAPAAEWVYSQSDMPNSETPDAPYPAEHHAGSAESRDALAAAHRDYPAAGKCDFEAAGNSGVAVADKTAPGSEAAVAIAAASTVAIAAAETAAALEAATAHEPADYAARARMRPPARRLPARLP